MEEQLKAFEAFGKNVSELQKGIEAQAHTLKNLFQKSQVAEKTRLRSDLGTGKVSLHEDGSISITLDDPAHSKKLYEELTGR